MTTNTHGGARLGAGRPKGAPNKAVADREAHARLTSIQLQAAGVSNLGDLTELQIAAMTPVEIIMTACIKEAVAGRWLNAADLASRAAPYRHAKLAHTTVDQTVRHAPDMTDEELLAFIGDGEEPEADGEPE